MGGSFVGMTVAAGAAGAAEFASEVAAIAPGVAEVAARSVAELPGAKLAPGIDSGDVMTGSGIWSE